MFNLQIRGFQVAQKLNLHLSLETPEMKTSDEMEE